MALKRDGRAAIRENAFRFELADGREFGCIGGHVLVWDAEISLKAYWSLGPSI